MSFEVEVTERFRRDAKALRKKYPSLKEDLERLISSLEENPIQGVLIRADCYKIRVTITSKARGKSGGARAITHVHVDGEKVYLLSIYDKSEKENISERDLEDRLKDIE